jgi:hypothetical protein
MKIGVLAASCAIAGIAAGSIADATASTPAAKARTKTSHAKGNRVEDRLLKLAGRTVAGSFVVDTKTGFVTVTIARGTLDSVSGEQLTLTEGTAKQAYKTVTLTLPSQTLVRDDRQISTLAQLTKGQRVAIVEGPKRALVVARPAASA